MKLLVSDEITTILWAGFATIQMRLIQSDEVDTI